MAIFERRAWGKVVLDDTQALKVTFEGTQNVHGHTVSADLNNRLTLSFSIKLKLQSHIYLKFFYYQCVLIS